MELSGEEKGYLAGILDGEGSFTLYHHGKGGKGVIHLQIQLLTTTNPLILDKCCAILDKRHIHYVISTWEPRDERWNKAWAIGVNRIDDQKVFISEIGPYIAGKAEQLRVASAWLSRRRSGKKAKYSPVDESLVQEMKALNARGNLRGTVETKRETASNCQQKLWSELHGDMQSTAETTVPLAKLQ